jgi:NADH-quinone oxidoreductase subunit I
MLRYFKDIGLGIITVMNSMWVACGHLFTPSVTLQYPTVKWTMPERARAKLFNKIEDCIGCAQCARVCPTRCITVKTEKRSKDEAAVFASDGTPIKLRTYAYDIDMALCCYCALCTFACPTRCLQMTPAYEYSAYALEDHICHFAKDRPVTGSSLTEQSAGAS